MLTKFGTTDNPFVIISIIVSIEELIDALSAPVAAVDVCNVEFVTFILLFTFETIGWICESPPLIIVPTYPIEDDIEFKTEPLTAIEPVVCCVDVTLMWLVCDDVRYANKLILAIPSSIALVTILKFLSIVLTS